MMVVVGGAGTMAIEAATPEQVRHANQRAATNAADQVLADVVLPAGAAQVPTEPAGDSDQLSRLIPLLFFAAEVDRHEFWTTTSRPSAVIASIRAHLPPGTTRSGWASSPTSAFASFTVPTGNPATPAPATLEVDAVKLARGGTGVRADAVVRYAAPRLPAQRIPRSAQVLDVAMANYHSAPTLSLTVTNPAEVRRIAAIVDHLPFIAPLRGVAISCAAIFPAPVLTFTFRTAPGGRIVATVSELSNTPIRADPCLAAALTIGGRREPGLLEGGILLRKAGAILHVRLTSRPSARPM